MATAQKSAKRKNRLPSPIPITSYDQNVQQIESTTLSHLSQTDNVNVQHSLHLPSPLNINTHYTFGQGYNGNNQYHHHHLQPLSLPSPYQSMSASQNTSGIMMESMEHRQRTENSSEIFYHDKLLKTDSFLDNNNDYNHKIHCLEYHKDTVLCVTKCQFLNKDQKLTEYIFSGSQDSSIGVWNTDTFQLKGTLLGHSRSILNLYVINDTIMNPLLLSTSRDNCICIWDIKTLSLLFRITGLPSLVYDIEVLSFPQNGGYYLYGCCQDTNIFSLSLSILPYLMKLQHDKLKIMDQHQKQLAAFKKKSKSKLNSKSPSKAKLKVNGISEENINDDPNVLNNLLLLNKPTILSPAGFKQIWYEQEQDDAVSELVMKHNDSNDDSSSMKPKGSVSPSKIIDVKLDFELPTSTNEIREIISTDPTVKFLSKSIHEIIDIYYDLMVDDDEEENDQQDDDDDKHMIHKIFGGCHHGFIFRMKQIRNEYKLITGGSDATIKIWDVTDKTVKLLSVLTGHSHSVIDFDLMGNEYLITASRDETLKVWNINNINKPHTRYTMNGHNVELTAIKVIHNGALIVSASRDGTVKFWDGKSYQCINTFKINQGPSSAVTNNGEDGNGFGYSSAAKSPNRLHKAWTCDADQIERDKPNCVMKFDFMEPSWLLLCDTAYRVEIWDVAPLLKLTPIDYASSLNNGSRINAYLPTLSPKKEIEQKWEEVGSDIESILNGLELSEYIENFKKEKVDYDALFYLSDNDLIQLDIPLGPRKKILKYIEQRNTVKNGHSNQNNNKLKIKTMMLPQRSDPKNSLFGGNANGHESYNMIADLSKFIAFKSISCQPRFQSECWNAAYFIQNKTEQFGAETRLVQGAVGKNPVVLAKFTNNLNINASVDKDNLVRIVMYGHYDVVDINNESGWTTPPFKLTGKNGYLYARGTTDNKGPIIVFLYAIRELLEELGHDHNKTDLSLEIIMILEGQEEHDWNNGGLKEVVEKNMDWLENPKVIICSNSYWVGDKVPCLVYGMRGHCRINVKVTGSKQDCHSGVHGGAFSEPMFDLISVLSKLKDPKTNKILIPGFYDNILPLKSDETKLYDEITSTFSTNSYLESIGFDKDKDKGDEKTSECGKALLMQKWRNPSLSIHNIQQSSNECTVISKYASAVISIRSVPNQNNMDIIDLCNKYLLNIFDGLSTYNSIYVSHNNIGSHWLMDYNNYIFKCAEKAIIEHWQIKPYYIREGGTIPCTHYLNTKLNCPVLQFPLGQSTDRAHLENERIRLQNLSKGKDVIKSFLMNLIQHHQQK